MRGSSGAFKNHVIISENLELLAHLIFIALSINSTSKTAEICLLEAEQSCGVRCPLLQIKEICANSSAFEDNL